MPFSSIAYNRGNRISTTAGVLLCDVLQQIDLRQTLQAVLTLPASPSPGEAFAPTAVSCPKVLQESVIPRAGPLGFYTRQAWLAPGTASVRCVALRAESAIGEARGEVSVLWVLFGVFAVEDSQGVQELTARTLPMMETLPAPRSGIGTWQARITAACRGCAIVSAPEGRAALKLRTGSVRVRMAAPAIRTR